MILNKKQQIVGWTMIVLIAAAILRTVLAMSSNRYLNIKIFLSLYLLIFIFGFLSVYVLRDSQNKGID